MAPAGSRRQSRRRGARTGRWARRTGWLPGSGDVDGRRSGAGHLRAVARGGAADLVEARAAVDRPVVPWCERHGRLATALAADRGVVLARTAGGPGSFRDGATRRTSLRIVQQPLAREEGLLTPRKDELLAAIATAQNAVLEHPCRTSDDNGAGTAHGGPVPSNRLPPTVPVDTSSEDSRVVKRLPLDSRDATRPRGREPCWRALHGAFAHRSRGQPAWAYRSPA